MNVVVGTAGWSIARQATHSFRAEGSALERYSRVFSGVEINSSFHRPHRASTWTRWAESVPEGFRFAVKVPKAITHEARLVDAGEPIGRFAEEVKALGHKLAILLVQLPPKLGFDAGVTDRFFEQLRSAIDAEIACEPRNATWFEDDADMLLDRLRVARVAADPALSPAAATPGGWRGLNYWRLHGSPAIYRSTYSEEALDRYAERIKSASKDAPSSWCMFDNTAASGATCNALSLMARL